MNPNMWEMWDWCGNEVGNGGMKWEMVGMMWEYTTSALQINSLPNFESFINGDFFKVLFILYFQ